MAEIIVFADKVNTALHLRTQLCEYGHTVRICMREDCITNSSHPQIGLLLISQSKFDRDTLSTCHELRALGFNFPILMINPTATTANIISYLEAGIDCVVDRVCNPRELVCRVSGILRRPPTSCAAFESRGLQLDHKTGTAYFQGDLLRLRRKEVSILSVLASKPGSIFSRDQIASQVRMSRQANRTAVDAQISNIRKALSPYGAEHLIDTVHGVGYRLVV